MCKDDKARIESPKKLELNMPKLTSENESTELWNESETYAVLNISVVIVLLFSSIPAVAKIQKVF